jgi:hypothetical protein
MQSSELPTSADWRDISCYPQAQISSNSRFAWEFLRRNSAYRCDWKSYATALLKLISHDEELVRFVAQEWLAPGGRRGSTEFENHNKYGRMFHRLEALPGWFVKEELDERKFVLRGLPQSYGVKWGISGMPNPDSAYCPHLIRFMDRKAVFYPTSSGVKKLEQETMEASGLPMMSAMKTSRHMIIGIDLRLPLQVIQSMVCQEIQRERRRRAGEGYFKPIDQRGQNSSLLIDYLRILDARTAGVCYSEIGAVLRPYDRDEPPDYSRSKRMRAAYKAARQISEEGYRHLPLLAEEAPPKALKKK